MRFISLIGLSWAVSAIRANLYPNLDVDFRIHVLEALGPKGHEVVKVSEPMELRCFAALSKVGVCASEYLEWRQQRVALRQKQFRLQHFVQAAKTLPIGDV